MGSSGKASVQRALVAYDGLARHSRADFWFCPPPDSFPCGFRVPRLSMPMYSIPRRRSGRREEGRFSGQRGGCGRGRSLRVVREPPREREARHTLPPASSPRFSARLQRKTPPACSALPLPLSPSRVHDGRMPPLACRWASTAFPHSIHLVLNSSVETTIGHLQRAYRYLGSHCAVAAAPQF